MPLDDPKESFYWKGEPWNMRRLSAKWAMFYAQKYKDKSRQAYYAKYIDEAEYDAGVQPLDPASFDSAFPHSFYDRTAEDDRPKAQPAATHAPDAAPPSLGSQKP